jgi:hypothetical protein
MKNGKITTNTKEIHRNIKEYFKNLYLNELKIKKKRTNF